MPRHFDSLIITCEHATNAVPPDFKDSFKGAEQVLDTHRAWDPGAAILARDLASVTGAPLFEGEFTRLLIDLNRGLDNPEVFSEFTPIDRREELAAYHTSWRRRIVDHLNSLSGNDRVLHLSIHSFTPALKGETREAEFGILFDPSAEMESKYSDWMCHFFMTRMPESRTRLNYPYDGVSDGTTSWLRREFGNTRYTGIEIEMNQSFATRPAGHWQPERQTVMDVIQATFAEPG